MNIDMLMELFNVIANPKEYGAFSERNRVGKTEVNGVIVSTVVTKDLGPETAILDENGTFPVERYTDKVAAKKGHDKWVEIAKTAKEITELGYPGLEDDRKRVLKRARARKK